jgi:hypothetical protein
MGKIAISLVYSEFLCNYDENLDSHYLTASRSQSALCQYLDINHSDLWNDIEYYWKTGIVNDSKISEYL